MPKLSIVVPTRERSDTLLHTIRTLVNQDYQDCEIIVSDNASKDDTRGVVESFSDSRIRYINTGKRVSMSENWEFALAHVKGEFVTYIGDDDGFLPGALTKAMDLLEKSQSNALIWDKAEYCWPDHIDDSYQNWLSVRTGNYSIQVVDGRKRLGKVISFREVYTRLPCIYNGIIFKAVIDRNIESSTNGAFFNSISPDVFSGIALSAIIDNYLLTNYPFSVNGASRHSNGTSLTRPQAADIDSPNAKFMSEQMREYDQRIMMGPSAAICVMGEYFLAKQFLPNLHLPEPRWDHYVNSLIRGARGSLLPDEILRSASHTAKMVGLGIKIPERIESRLELQPNIGIKANVFSFKAPIDAVSNIFEACQLISGMLPKAFEGETTHPFSRFIKQVKDCVTSEAKTLYRSL